MRNNLYETKVKRTNLKEEKMMHDIVQETIFQNRNYQTRDTEIDSKYVINTDSIIENNGKLNQLSQSSVTIIKTDYVEESNEEKLTKLITEDPKNQDPEKLKIGAMILYYSINSELVKIERSLRDANNVRLVLTQKYDRAKESLFLHDKIISIQTNDARDYFGILCAIYDSVVKYTLPSAQLIADLSRLQSEIEIRENKEKENKELSLNLPKVMTKNSKNSNSKDIIKFFEETASSVEKNRSKYLNLEKSARDICQMSLHQRDIIDNDTIVILQNISEVNDKITKIKNDYNRKKENMDKLLRHMVEKLAMQIKNDIPLLE